MDMHALFRQYLKACPLMPILRGVIPAEIDGVAGTIFDAGIPMLEIPLNSPDALVSIGKAGRLRPGQTLVGAGTVLNPEEVRQVADAGGRFIISPNTDAAVIRETVRLGLVSLPGFMTPTEGFCAMAAGADYLKLFPAGRLGIGYLKDVQAVIKAPMLAVGGVGVDNAAEYLRLCVGVGIGSALYAPGKSLVDLRAAADALVAAVRADKK